MFDDGSSVMNNVPQIDEPNDSRTADERLQYTIKGIERRSVELMRSAAKQDGMKIGVWVSRRMREAAEASLDGRAPSYASQEEPADAHVGEPASKEVLDALRTLQREIEAIRENQKLLIAGLISGNKE